MVKTSTSQQGSAGPGKRSRRTYHQPWAEFHVGVHRGGQARLSMSRHVCTPPVSSKRSASGCRVPGTPAHITSPTSTYLGCVRARAARSLPSSAPPLSAYGSWPLFCRRGLPRTRARADRTVDACPPSAAERDPSRPPSMLTDPDPRSGRRATYCIIHVNDHLATGTVSV
jgi:hypothetical protein